VVHGRHRTNRVIFFEFSKSCTRLQTGGAPGDRRQATDFRRLYAANCDPAAYGGAFLPPDRDMGLMKSNAYGAALRSAWPSNW
jgi:hypothetical protein